MATEKRLIDVNKISYHKSGFPKGNGYDGGLDWAFREDIDKIPTVDAVEVVHSEWETELDELGWLKHTCPICGYVKRTDIHVRLGWNYCPNCGAKMDGVQE